MSIELISILVLVVIFVIATTLPINMGALAFAAAFLVGVFAADLSADDIFGGFPGNIFVVLVGVTFLFAIAQVTGPSTGWSSSPSAPLEDTWQRSRGSCSRWRRSLPRSGPPVPPPWPSSLRSH